MLTISGVNFGGESLRGPETLERQGSAINQRGRERKGTPEIIQKFRLRNWPISSADLRMTPMEGTAQHFGIFRTRILGQYPAASCSPGPLVCV